MTILEVSIIIPAYNEETLIVNTLESLRAYMATRAEKYEFIIVDDGNHDKMAALLLLRIVVVKQREIEPAGIMCAKPRGRAFSVRP